MYPNQCGAIIHVSFSMWHRKKPRSSSRKVSPSLTQPSEISVMGCDLWRLMRAGQEERKGSAIIRLERKG